MDFADGRERGVKSKDFNHPSQGTKYRLKLSALFDLLEILWVQKQVEAPAEQDRFRC